MSTDSSNTPVSKGTVLSLDTWAVILGLALALAVKLGLLSNVPW